MARRKARPLNILVDTSVWLDLAKDHREQPIIGAIEDLVKDGRLKLIIPSVVLDEFARNKERVAEETKRSFQSHFRVVRDAVDRFAEDATKAGTMAALQEVDHAIAMKSAAVDGSLARIEKILASTPALPTSAAVKQRVTERALAKSAPYHREKNSVGDAILIEAYAEVLAADLDKPSRYAFVTHNIKDFSAHNGDRRKPHADLAAMFTPPRSRYSVSIAELIREIDADLLDEHVFEVSYGQQSRTLTEILDAENLLVRQVWYNRHCNRLVAIEEGRIHLVPESKLSRKPYQSDQILDTIWAGALAAAKQTEEEVGLENLGPWDDFDWGMINGKLSALRWVLGDDWDMLDT